MMAKKDRNEDTENQEMSLEESKAFRAALYVAPKKDLTDLEKREQFRQFWAREKRKYDQPKSLEPILWAHLKSAKLDSPEKFEDGMKSFGLKKAK